MIDQIIQLLYSALFFITPLLMTKSTSELFEFNKMLFIYSSTVLVVFFWFLKMILNKKIILKKTPLDIPIIVFFFSQLISTLFSLDIHNSIFGYYGRFNGGLLSIICYILLYYGLVSNIVNVEKILKSIIASSLLVVLWAIPGHFGHDLTCLLFVGQFDNSCWDNSTLAFRPELRAFSTLGQPNWLGAFLVATFFIGIYFLLKNSFLTTSSVKISKSKNEVEDSYNFKSILQGLAWSGYLILNFTMVLFSRSRSALLALFIGLLLFCGYYVLFIKINTRKLLIILLLITIIPVLVFKTGIDKFDNFITLETYRNIFVKKPALVQPTNNNSPTANPSLVTESFDIRKIVWQGAWDLSLRYPLFGTGVETFAFSYNFVRPITHNLTSEWDYVYNKAHNEYFNFLATTGFLGLISYLSLIVIFITYTLIISKPKPLNSETIKQFNNRNLRIILLIAYITILITNFFGFSTTTIQLLFYLIPGLVIIDNRQQAKAITEKQTLSNFQWLAIFVVSVSGIYFLFSIVVYYLADVNYSNGLKYYRVNDQQKAAEYFENALKLREEPVYIDKLSSSLGYLSALAGIQKQSDLAKQIASLSDTYNRKTIESSPKNIFYWKTRAKNMFYFYQVTNDPNQLLQGVEALKTARGLYPTDPKIPYSLALYYSTLYDTTNVDSAKASWQQLSLDEINNTIRLKPNYQEGYLFKGQLLKKYKLTSEAKKTFEYILENFNSNDAEALKELQSL